MNIGDTVRLASGGPDMLIVEIDQVAMRAACVWDTGKDWFPLACLRPRP